MRAPHRLLRASYLAYAVVIPAMTRAHVGAGEAFIPTLASNTASTASISHPTSGIARPAPNLES